MRCQPKTAIPLAAIPLTALLLGGMLAGCASTAQQADAPRGETRITMNQGSASELVLPGRELAMLSGPGSFEFGRNDARLGVRGLDAVAGSYAPPPPDLRFARRITLPRQADQFLVPYSQLSLPIFGGRRYDRGLPAWPGSYDRGRGPNRGPDRGWHRGW